MTKDSDLRRKMQEDEAERDRVWDGADCENNGGHYDRLINDQQQRVGLAMILLTSGQSGPEVERALIATMLSDPLMPVTQALEDAAEGLVDLARFRIRLRADPLMVVLESDLIEADIRIDFALARCGVAVPGMWTPFEPDPRPHPDHPEQEEDDDDV